ncbi:MAG TPA: cobalamin-independent methionine synthase II family protein [Longimicrobium sp.]|nr:cobalamin-independent methionine synthase II family protein [Longimicrobium sp.]
MTYPGDESTLRTTVVGSYTVPDWYPALRDAVAAGRLPPQAFADARAVAARAAIKDQEDAGIDVVSDGELFRRSDNAFGPPNAMIAHFAARIPGFAPGLRPKTGITPVAPDAALPAPVVVDALRPAPLGLVDELRFLRETTRRPVKIAMTGPHMFARVAWDEHYGGPEALAMDLARVINAELRRLDQAGCDVIQLDEPVLWFLPGDREWALRAVRACFEGVERATTALHLCQGNYNPDPAARRGLRIFPSVFADFAPIVAGAGVDAVLLACAGVDGCDPAAFAGLPAEVTLVLGVVDVQDHRVETADEVARRLERAAAFVDPARLWAAPDCGMNHLPRDVAWAKLRALAGGARLAAGRLAHEAVPA